MFCLVKWAKINAFSSIGKMKLIKMLNLLQPIEFSLSPISALLLPSCSTSSFQKLAGKVQNHINEFLLMHSEKNEFGALIFYIILDFFSKFLKT